jgi:hypothetical protein
VTCIVSVKEDSSDGVWVTFSDGTAAGYVVEELLELRPIREQCHVERLTESTAMDKET